MIKKNVFSKQLRFLTFMIFKKLTFLGIIFFVLSAILFVEGNSSAQERWSDTFFDTSKTETLVNLIQITESVGIGTSFTPYSGNPLLTIETCDPWDGNGPPPDPLYQIPGSVQPDVLYFPDGIDGYKFWMVFTPLDDTPPPGVESQIPPQIPVSKYDDYWWERPTIVRSNDGINWEKTSDYTNPVVSPGPYGTWDGNAELCDPDLVYAPGRGPDGESWFLYYVGQGPTGSTIGLALSHDGLHYTKYPGNPLIPNYSACPGVVYDQTTGTFHAWFSWGSVSNGRVGYATSPDGINWTPHNNSWDDGVVVLQATPGTYDQGGISHLDVIYYQDQYWMYYLAQPTSAYAGCVIGLATSPDGINWTKNPQPATTPGETWTFYQPPWLGTNFVDTVRSLYRPSAVVVGDTMYLYYGGTDTYQAYPANTYETGLAFSKGPDGHVELQSDSNPAEYASKLGTIAWYHMNEDASEPIYPGEYLPLDQTLAWYHMNEDPYESPYPGEYTPLDQTLVWYHFNEGSGLTTEDSGGAVNDEGILNDPGWTAGLYGNALSFDGNDIVTAADSAELNPDGAITIEVWVNPSLNQPINYVVSKVTPGGGDYSYGVNLSNGEIQCFIRPASGGSEYYANGGSVPTGTWTHIAMTYEMNPAESTYISVYQNGTEVTYTQRDLIPAATYILTNPGSLNVGCLPIGGYYYYEGLIDELRILGRALSPEEIETDGAIFPQGVVDSSGNDNDGVAASPLLTTGLYGNALSFDGNDLVTVADSTELNPINAITIEAWVNPSVVKPVDYVVSKVTPGGNDYAYGLYLDNGEIQAFIRPSSAGSEYYANGGSVPTGTWTHIAMTYEKDDVEPTLIRLYQNGVEVTAYSRQDTIPAGTTILTNAGSLNIGCLPIGGYYYYEGLIDELRILGRALSPEELASDGTITNTSEVLDTSGNENHGLPAGGVDWIAGLIANGLVFDGSTGFVTVPHSPELNPGEAITMEMWVNPAINKQNNYLVIKMTPVASDYSYGIYLENGEIQCFIRPASGGSEYYANGGSVPTGTWTHIAMTYEMNPGEDDYITVYQNGVEVTYTRRDSIPAGTSILDNTGLLNIGYIPWVTSYRYYNGIIDELRILSRALTPEEIAEDYGSTYTPSGNLTSVLIPPPPGGWNFFYAMDNRLSETSIHYSILDEAGGILMPSVNSGEDISSLGTVPLRLHGQLSTSNPLLTPRLDEWGLSSGEIPGCDSDDDCDGICNAGEFSPNCHGWDNCTTTPNPAQEDTSPPQANGCGDACECEGNFDGDEDQDGSDAFTFKVDFGRSSLGDPCTPENPCNGNFNCDEDVDGSDAFTFKQDFGRSPLLNPCPDCVTIPWCE